MPVAGRPAADAADHLVAIARHRMGLSEVDPQAALRTAEAITAAMDAD